MSCSLNPDPHATLAVAAAAILKADVLQVRENRDCTNGSIRGEHPC